MRNTPPPTMYPVDRYLVESSKQVDVFDILQDENWHTEPVLRPEDELLLNKLQNMLQYTADDLKVLSNELTKYREIGTKPKTLPTPLDKEFNEKVRIKEAVDAKFFGYKIGDKPENSSKINKINDVIIDLTEKEKPKLVNIGVQAGADKNKGILGFKKNLLNQINIEAESSKTERETQGEGKNVSCKEVHFKYIDTETPSKLNVQEMPRINIRSALTQQKIIQLNIQPPLNMQKENENNIIVEFEHEPYKAEVSEKYVNTEAVNFSKSRKITIIPNNDEEYTSDRSNSKIDDVKKLSTSSSTTKTKRSQDYWKKKRVFNNTYSKKSKPPPEPSKRKLERKSISKKSQNIRQNINNGSILNKAEYIPYSKLTLGGVNVSDIEKEIVSTEYKGSMPLTPILSKILSRENSMSKSPREIPKILSISEEKLLHEVLDIEETVNNTISQHFEQIITKKKDDKDNGESEVVENSSYADDFENSDNIKNTNSTKSTDTSLGHHTHDDEEDFEKEIGSDPLVININETLKKSNTLSFKNNIDVYECVHVIDRQDIATQSNGRQKVCLKGTQTSQVETQVPNLLATDLKENLITKILDEYTYLIERKFTKPTTSNSMNNVERPSNDKNIYSLPKNTQTSPARLKSTMTSPIRTNTRTTSPLLKTFKIDRKTSPLDVISNQTQVSNRNNNVSSPDCTSTEVESCNSSDFSSLGEIRLKMRKKTNGLSSSSECSQGSYLSGHNSNMSSAIVRLRSEGESSKVLGRSEGEMSMVNHKSEGEVSFKLL